MNLVKKYKYIFLSLFFGIGFWFIDAIIDSNFFYKASFIESAITHIEPVELYIRVLTIVLFLLFGVIISFHLNQKKHTDIHNKRLTTILKTISSINQIIVKERDKEQFLLKICNKFSEYKGYQSAWILLFDEGKIENVYQSNLDDSIKNFKKSIDEKGFGRICKNAILHQELIYVKNLSLNCPDCKLYENPKFQILCKRLEFQGKIYGILEVALSTDYLCDPEELSNFSQVVDDIAYGLHGLELEKEKEKIISSLVSSEKKFHSMFESMNEGVALHELVFEKNQPVNYRILNVNPAFEKILGKNKENFIGFLATECYHTENPPHFEEYSQVALTGTPCFFESYFPPMDKYFQISAFSPIQNQFATVFADISERKINEKKLQHNIEEKNLLLKEIHHRVKNNFQIIISLLNLQSKSYKDTRLLEAFTQSTNRIYSMALVHEKLYNTSDFSNIDIKDYIESLVRELNIFFQYKSNLKFNLNISKIALGLDIAIPCGLLINELVTNAFKHAFIGIDNCEIIITFIEKGNHYELSVKDNGVGLNKDLEITNSSTFGLKLITILTDQLKGSLEIDQNQGTNFIIIFPILQNA